MNDSEADRTKSSEIQLVVQKKEGGVRSLLPHEINAHLQRDPKTKRKRSYHRALKRGALWAVEKKSRSDNWASLMATAVCGIIKQPYMPSLTSEFDLKKVAAESGLTKKDPE